MGWVSSQEGYNGAERLMGLLQTDGMPNFGNDDQFEAFAMALLHQMGE